MMMRRQGRMIGVLFAVLLAGAFTSASSIQATPKAAPLLAPMGTSFTYQGFITYDGNPADGIHDFRFKLYDSESHGSQVGSTVLANAVPVTDGYFTVELDFGNLFDGTELWLQIEVAKSEDVEYTLLSPRQVLNAAPYAHYALNIPDHNHFGETWSGTATQGLRVTNNGTSGTRYGLYGENSSPDGYGVRGYSDASSGDAPGVYGSSPVSPDGRGVLGIARYGVYGESWNSNGYGLYGEAMSTSGTNYGVYGESNSSGGYGGYFVNSGSDGPALYATGDGSGRADATLLVDNTEATGGIAAYMTNDSTFATAHFSNGGSGEVLYLQNGGTDAVGTDGGYFIVATNEPENDIQFSVSSEGNVYSDGGYHCGNEISDAWLLPDFSTYGLSEGSIDPCLRDSVPADFAEMLPADKFLEPGDVLAIGTEGELIQSSERYQTTVVGVYSYRPSFLGNAQFADEDGYAPVALLGIVPVKASAENGGIQPGDLLVASSTAGHAMKAGEAPPQGSVIGKALEPLHEGLGFIHMIVTLQ